MNLGSTNPNRRRNNRRKIRHRDSPSRSATPMKVNIHFHDGPYDPAEHPHAPAGNAKGGQFVKKGAAPLAAQSTFKQFQKHIRNLNGIANEEGTTNIEKAAAIKKAVAGMKSYKLLDYANKLLSHLDQPQ